MNSGYSDLQGNKKLLKSRKFFNANLMVNDLCNLFQKNKENKKK